MKYNACNSFERFLSVLCLQLPQLMRGIYRFLSEPDLRPQRPVSDIPSHVRLKAAQSDNSIQVRSEKGKYVRRFVN